MKKPRRSRFAKLALKALQVAVAKAMDEHRRKGLPIYIWQDNKVVRIPANRI